MTLHLPDRPACLGGDCPACRAHCRSNLAVPLAPWLLARTVRRMWRQLRGQR